MSKTAFSLGFILSIVALSCTPTTAKKAALVPFYETQLFKDAQLTNVFKDSKTLVDLVPDRSYSDLDALYQEAKEADDFDINAFVNTHFEDRFEFGSEFSTDTTKTMYEHIDSMWDKLTRPKDSRHAHGTRIPLPKPYVVPGGRFREIYYWDSYFTIEGLLASDRADLAKNMIDNFGFLLDSIGFIPNGTRDYYRTRSQPPFFATMVDALGNEEQSYILYYLPQLAKEYDFWMDGKDKTVIARPQKHVVNLEDKVYLNRYWDAGDQPRPESYKEDYELAQGLATDSLQTSLYKNLRSAAESGWDFSSRWFGTKGEFNSTETTDILPVDLNCLLYFLELKLSRGLGEKGDNEGSSRLVKAASLRKQAINHYMFNEETRYYHDYNFKNQAVTNEITLAGVYPLFFKIALKEQAEGVKNRLMEQFLKPGGLVTTLDHTGQQWDAPNGWAPLQFMAVKGLLNYGYEEEAKIIMTRWLALNEKVYKNTGKMMEKYNVEDLSLLSGGGEYETQDGFGWTNGVALVFRQLLDAMEAESK